MLYHKPCVFFLRMKQICCYLSSLSRSLIVTAIHVKTPAMQTPSHPLQPIIILGPTAGGKSELAVALAEHFDGEILGADSMQVYRHLDAGTAKPEKHLQDRAPHHLINIVEPTEAFSVSDWLGFADPLIQKLQDQGKRPVIVGGTNLYLKTLLEGFFEGPPADPDFRQSLAKFTPAELHKQLQTLDPDAAERIHPNDRKRLIRALEVYHATGKSISQWQQQWEQRPTLPYRHDPILIGLQWETAAINQRINARVKIMFQPADETESLPSETKRLEDADLLGEQARQALGYKQVLDHLVGRGSLNDAMEQTKILTRRFAKQQRTWLRRFVGIHWLNATENDPASRASQAIDFVTQA